MDTRFELSDYEREVLDDLCVGLARWLNHELPRLGLVGVQLEIALAEDLAANAPREAERP